MFQVIKEEDEPVIVAECETRDNALEVRVLAVQKWLRELEDDGYIDKYGAEDWTFGAINCTDDSYYVDEKTGCEFKIVEV